MDLKAVRQDIFDRAYAGLKAQGFKQSLGIASGHSESDTTEPLVCKYRGRDGLKCAVGHLIKDDAIAAEYDRFGAIGDCLDRGDAASRYEFFASLGIKDLDDVDADDVITFLGRLQTVHDLSDSPEDMMSDLCAFAHKENLEVPR